MSCARSSPRFFAYRDEFRGRSPIRRWRFDADNSSSSSLTTVKLFSKWSVIFLVQIHRVDDTIDILWINVGEGKRLAIWGIGCRSRAEWIAGWSTVRGQWWWDSIRLFMACIRLVIVIWNQLSWWISRKRFRCRNVQGFSSSSSCFFCQQFLSDGFSSTFRWIRSEQLGGFPKSLMSRTDGIRISSFDFTPFKFFQRLLQSWWLAERGLSFTLSRSFQARVGIHSRRQIYNRSISFWASLLVHILLESIPHFTPVGWFDYTRSNPSTWLFYIEIFAQFTFFGLTRFVLFVEWLILALKYSGRLCLFAQWSHRRLWLSRFLRRIVRSFFLVGIFCAVSFHSFHQLFIWHGERFENIVGGTETQGR